MQDNIESKWQKRWAKNRIFEPSIEPKKEKFLVTVPWPYASGSLHVGHGRTFTYGDIIARYKRSRGYNVLFPMGFHESGTPVLAISQKMRKKDRATIEQYKEYLKQYTEHDPDAVIKRFEEPSEIASYFANAIIHDFTRMGYSIDWTRRFRSAEPMYQEFVKWQFKKLDELGYIKRGDYPLLYSAEDGNPVGEDDIKDGDTDKVSIEEFVAVKFKGDDFSIVAGSLRPETVFGITNLWIARKGDYLIVDMDGEKIAASSAAVEKLKHQHVGVKVIGTIDRKKLKGMEFTVPITGKRIKLLESSFVDTENATGFVYSVPGHSIWDYVALKESGYRGKVEKVIDMVDPEMNVESLVGKFGIHSLSDISALNEATQVLYRDEFYSGKMNGIAVGYEGMPASKARDSIREKLISEHNAFIFYETSRDAVTRSGSKVIVAVVKGQWFIDYSDRAWKDKTHSLIDSMFFLPDYVRKAFHDSIEWLKQRPCARTRGLGTKLPFDDRWVIESLSDSTIYPAVYTNATELRKLFEQNGSLNPELLNHIFVDHSNLAESSELVEYARKEREYWYGVDLRITAPAHISNHLSFYLMNHVALFGSEDQPKGILISGMLTSKGAKIGKSKGNVVSLVDTVEKYSADVYRLFAAVGADISSELDWNESDVSATTKKLDQFKDLMGRYSEEDAELTYIEKWFVASFFSRYRSYSEWMDRYSLRQAYVSIFHEVLNDLRYLETRGGRVNVVLAKVLRHWLVALAPVIPHIVEEFWHRHIEDSFASLAVLPPIPDGINENILKMQLFAEKVADDVREIIKATGIKPSTITIGIASPELNEFHKIMQKGKTNEIKQELKPLISEYIKVRKFVNENSIDELDSIRENSKSMAEMFGCPVIVEMAKINLKSKNAWPGRPLIQLK